MSLFEQYQKQACKTFKVHKPLDAHQAEIVDWALGLPGEAGEVDELVKHHIFHNEPMDLMKLSKEMGDVLWYIAALSTTFDINLQDVADLNLAKLQHRYSQGYSHAGSADRHEQEEKFTDSIMYRIMEARILRKEAPMNVIFIGPDGSGKTSLAQAVAKKIGWEYIHNDWQVENKPQACLEALNSRINVIYDRFHWPDEQVYCTLKKELHPSEYWAQFNEVVTELTKRNTLYIYVTASLETLQERAAQWKDTYVTKDELPRLVEIYNKWFLHTDRRVAVSTCFIDTTGIDVDTPEFAVLVQECITAIETGRHVYSRLPEEVEKDGE